MEMASDMNVWWKNMVGSEKNSLEMQSSGTKKNPCNIQNDEL